MSEKQETKDIKKRKTHTKAGLKSNIISEGIVNLSIQNRNGVVKDLGSHNSGAIPLFKFIGLCLTGDYSSAELLRPFKIKLYKINADSEVQGIPDKPQVNKQYEVTSFISLAETAILRVDESNNTVSTILHFVVPYTYIASGYNQICLYGLNENNNAKYSAYYFLTDENGNLYTETVEANTNYNLFIDWELRIAGKIYE